jgi:hypothetical protein
MTVSKAKKIVKMYFEYNTEASSWAYDLGMFTKSDVKSMDDETLVLVAEDLEQQLKEELY